MITSEPARILQTVHLTGVGAALPDPVLTNEQLSRLVETSDDWVWPRTGIRERRIAPPEMSLVDLTAEAAQRALHQAGVDPAELDLIVLATSTNADRFGSGPHLQHRLGANRAVAFDLSAACTGFVYALTTASQFLRTGMYRRALVVAGDLLSRTVDWTDRTTCILFGDGAGAVVLEAAEPDRPDGILGVELRTDGGGGGLLTLGMATEPLPLVDQIQVGRYQCQPIAMNGREVYKFAVTEVPEVIEKALFRAKLDPQAIQGYFIHQANQRILDAVTKRLEVDPGRMASVLERYGNTSGASVAIALDDWQRQGQLKPGDLGVLAGFGAGLTWGSVVFRWGRL